MSLSPCSSLGVEGCRAGRQPLRPTPGEQTQRGAGGGVGEEEEGEEERARAGWSPRGSERMEALASGADNMGWGGGGTSHGVGLGPVVGSTPATFQYGAGASGGCLDTQAASHRQPPPWTAVSLRPAGGVAREGTARSALSLAPYEQCSLLPHCTPRSRWGPSPQPHRGK